MKFLEKVEKAIDFLESEKVKGIEVYLTYAELKTIRKHILLDRYEEKISAENLKAGLDFSKSLKGK